MKTAYERTHVKHELAATGLLCLALRRTESASIRAWVREPRHWIVWRDYARTLIGRPDAALRLSTRIVCEAIGL